MEFKQAVIERYATKLFDGRKIPKRDFDELMEIIRHAPSSFNIQPWKIIVIEDQPSKEMLSPLSWDQPQIKSCSHLLVFCANKDIAGNISLLETEMIKKGAKPNEIKGYIQMMRDFEKSLTNDQKLSWAQRQTYLALSNAVNGAKSLGFDSCPMEGFDPSGYSKALNLPTNLIPTALCAIGYAADEPKPKLRLPIEAVVKIHDASAKFL